MPNYYLGPWQWQSDPDGESYWGGPEGTSIDLRTLPQMQAGDPGIGIFVTPASIKGPLSREYELLGSGDWSEIKPNARLRSAFGGGVQGETLAQCVRDVLTRLSDPDGLDAPKPLMPTVRQRLELVCGPSTRTTERFHLGQHAHSNRVLAVLQKDFRRQWEADSDLARRTLDYQREKLRLRGDGWQDLVPADLRDHVEGPLPHSTTISDDFERADGTLGSSAEGWNWNTSGTWAILNGQARTVSGNRVYARANTDLSSSDNMVVATFVAFSASNARFMPGCCRFSASTAEFYGAMARNTGTEGRRIAKLVGGVLTYITQVNGIVPLPSLVGCMADGSTISYLLNSVVDSSTTDTSLTSGFRGGMLTESLGASGTGHKVEDWSAADLAVDGRPGLAKTLLRISGASVNGGITNAGSGMIRTLQRISGASING